MFHIFCIRIDLPFCLSTLLNFGFRTLLVHIWIVVCYVFAFCGIWLVLLLRVLFRLFCIFLMLPGYWASPYQPSHVGSGKTMKSPIDSGCYHHCHNYSSDGELQCQPTITMSLPRQSTLGSHLHLFNAMTLSSSWANCWHCLTWDHMFCFTFTFHTLWSPENCITSDQWVW